MVIERKEVLSTAVEIPIKSTRVTGTGLTQHQVGLGEMIKKLMT
jgi:hypothetical protein